MRISKLQTGGFLIKSAKTLNYKKEIMQRILII